MIKDLDIPVEGKRDPNYVGTTATRVRSSRKARRGEEERRHRRELKRARRAARRVFKTRPGLSARKRATLMLTAGAVGLGAFTGPQMQRNKPKVRAAVVQVEDVNQLQERRQPAAMLSASEEFKQALIEEEGVRYVVYRDVAGYPTVGVGHLVERGDNLRVGDRVSHQRVLEFLDQDLIEAEEGVRELVGDLPLFQHEFDALVDLVFNVGIGNVSERKSPRLNAAIADGDYQAIADELDYTHAGGKVARGLQFRSERRARIWAEATYEDPRAMDVDVAEASGSANV